MTELEIRAALLLIPRESRARAQRMKSVFEFNGIIIKRSSKRFWFVGASLLRLDEAVRALEAV